MCDPIDTLVCRLDLDRTSSLVCQPLSFEANKKIASSRAGGMAQQLWAPPTLLEDPGWIPIPAISQLSVTLAPGELTYSTGLHGDQAHTWCTNTCLQAKHPHTHATKHKSSLPPRSQSHSRAERSMTATSSFLSMSLTHTLYV